MLLPAVTFSAFLPPFAFSVLQYLLILNSIFLTGLYLIQTRVPAHIDLTVSGERETDRRSAITHTNEDLITVDISAGEEKYRVY